MSESSVDGTAGESRARLKDAEGLVRALGLIFSNTYLYGPKHGVTLKALDDGYQRTQSAMRETLEIQFNITDEGVVVNGESIELKNPLARTFATHLIDLEVPNFVIERGLSREAYNQLMEVLNAKPEELRALGGFSKFIADAGIGGVRSRRVTMQQVDEDETVVDGQAVENAFAAGMVEAGGGGNDGGGKGESDLANDSAKGVETILAFLKGELDASDPALQSGLEAVPDAKRLGELILRAAEVRQMAQTSGGENFSDIIIGCLRRVHEGLSKQPGAKTQKGRKAISKSLMLMEREVLDKLRNMAGTTSEAEQKVHDVVEELVDELAIDSLTTEYLKRREAVESSESRILRYLKKKGGDQPEDSEIRERLMEGGLSDTEWKELLIRSKPDASNAPASGAGAGPSMGGGGDVAALGNLANLLVELEKRVQTIASDEKGQVAELAKTLGQSVSETATATEEKLATLGNAIRQDQDTVDKIEQQAIDAGAGLHIPRRRLFAMLAEIAQELCQPLSVVNCAVQIIHAQNIGKLDADQLSLVELALKSGERLQVLVDNLKTICGMPDNMTPDAGIQETLYGTGSKAGGLST